MDKQRVIASVSCMLARGGVSEGETALFAGMAHKELVDRFRHYLEAHRQFLPDMQLETSHALNEKGVDLLLRAYDVRIGFQLKSHFDVKEDNFRANVLRQLAESRAHGLDKFYILVCSPLDYKRTDYRQKISWLINDLSILDTNYHCVFGPQNVARMFDRTAPLSGVEFTSCISMYTYEPTQWDKLLVDLSKKIDEAVVQLKREDAAGNHDRARFGDIEELLNEPFLDEFLNNLETDHKYRAEAMNGIEEFCRHVDRVGNCFLDGNIMANCERLRSAFQDLLRFTFRHFEPFPENQTDRYCLMPRGNVDRSNTTTAESRAEYDRLRGELDSIVEAIRQRYAAFRQLVKERLAV